MKSQLIPALAGAAICYMIVTSLDEYVPIVKDLDPIQISRSQNSVDLRVTGYKIRNCNLVSGSLISWYMTPEGYWKETTEELTFPEDLSADSNRPSGLFDKQDFGIFRISGINKSTTSVRVTVNHDCGSNIRISILGPWEIKIYE